MGMFSGYLSHSEEITGAPSLGEWMIMSITAV